MLRNPENPDVPMPRRILLFSANVRKYIRYISLHFFFPLSSFLRLSVNPNFRAEGTKVCWGQGGRKETGEDRDTIGFLIRFVSPSLR